MKTAVAPLALQSGIWLAVSDVVAVPKRSGWNRQNSQPQGETNYTRAAESRFLWRD